MSSLCYKLQVLRDNSSIFSWVGSNTEVVLGSTPRPPALPTGMSKPNPVHMHLFSMSSKQLQAFWSDCHLLALPGTTLPGNSPGQTGMGGLLLFCHLSFWGYFTGDGEKELDGNWKAHGYKHKSK